MSLVGREVGAPVGVGIDRKAGTVGGGAGDIAQRVNEVRRRDDGGELPLVDRDEVAAIRVRRFLNDLTDPQVTVSGALGSNDENGHMTVAVGSEVVLLDGAAELD